MVDILNLQFDDEAFPITPGTEKRSVQSMINCHNSAVSILACPLIGR